MIAEFPLTLPRHAFSPRDVARAGDVWRAFQEAAVEASTRAGWPPGRFREAGTAFVVRAMTVRHMREATYGDRLTARTWVWGFRRDMLSTREIRLDGVEGPVAAATQEWVHVASTLKPVRASAELVGAFPPHAEGESVGLPAFDETPGPTHRWSFPCWHTWMDPLAHVNHPAYIDFCDEVASRRLAERGVDPVTLRPVAERVQFRAGMTAPQEIVVRSRRLGVTADGDVVLHHRIERGDGTLAADATTVRALTRGDAALLASAFD